MYLYVIDFVLIDPPFEGKEDIYPFSKKGYFLTVLLLKCLRKAFYERPAVRLFLNLVEDHNCIVSIEANASLHYTFASNRSLLLDLF